MLDKMSRYGFWGSIKMFWNLVKTKTLFPGARLIRFPFDVRGKKYIKIGEGLTTGVGCRLEVYPQEVETKKTIIHVGKNVQFNDYIHITAIENVTIGDNVLMASKIYISDCTHGSYAGNGLDSHPEELVAGRKLFSKPVFIEDNVWLGEFVSVLPGVCIGKNTIVGANSVVSKSLPPNVIAVGSPAKAIKQFNFETKCWERVNN